MSTDIVAYVEYKSGQEMLSVTEGSFNFYQEYEFFNAISSVRGGSPLIEPRGLPEQLSYKVKEAWELLEGKCPSWLTRNEIIKSCDHAGLDLEDTPLSAKIILAVMDQIKKEKYINDCRFVFWFI